MAMFQECILCAPTNRQESCICNSTTLVTSMGKNHPSIPQQTTHLHITGAPSIPGWQCASTMNKLPAQLPLPLGVPLQLLQAMPVLFPITLSSFTAVATMAATSAVATTAAAPALQRCRRYAWSKGQHVRDAAANDCAAEMVRCKAGERGAGHKERLAGRRRAAAAQQGCNAWWRLLLLLLDGW